MTPDAEQSNLGSDISGQYIHDSYIPKWAAGKAPPHAI